MKKKLLVSTVVAAIAPLSALADDSSVTIYGRINVSLESTQVKNDFNPVTGNSVPDLRKTEVVDNASRIGFLGKEDLGGGMAGIFQVESRIRADKSGDTWASRDSFVGLQGGFGTIRLGRTIGPVYYQTYDSLPETNHDTGNSSDVLLAPTIFGNSGFMNNTIWYTSPSMGGFTLEAAYSLLSEAPLVAGNNTKPHYGGIVGAFDKGPLHVALSYAETKNSADLCPAAAIIAGLCTETKFNDDKAVTVMGTYDFKALVLGLLYERAKSDLITGDVKRNYYKMSLMVPVAQHEFHVEVGHVDHRLDNDLDDTGATQWTLGYNYNLSKRTKVYAFYTKVDNKSANFPTPGSGGNYGFLPSLAGSSFGGVDNESFALGIRHNF